MVPGVPVRSFEPERCGADALSIVLAATGDHVDPAELDLAIPRTGGGVLSLDLLLAARARGHDARLVRGDAGQIERTVRAGRPAILMVRALDAPGSARDLYHFVVVDGVEPGRGRVRIQLGDGRARWTRLARLDEAWDAAGYALLLLGERARHTDPPPGEVRHAVHLQQEGHADEAAAALERLLRSHPESALLWTNLGNVERERGRLAEAEAAYRRAVALAPVEPDAANNLAWLLLEAGDTGPEAEALARRAVELGGPDPHLALDTLGRILIERGGCHEAQALFRRAAAGAATLGPHDLAHVLTGLARAQIACGLAEEGRTTLHGVLALAPGSDAASEARSLLAPAVGANPP